MTALDAFGHGCAFFDANGDGRLDVLLVGEPTSALFLNLGNGRFEDVTQRSGIGALKGAWKGCAIGDYDADGVQDILLTGYNVRALLHGAADSTYHNVTKVAGLTPDGWSSSAGFMDLDDDGYLDLFVGYYVVYNDKTPHYCDLGGGVKSGCPPATYAPQFGKLYRNNRNGTFTDVTVPSGLAGHTHGKCLVVAYADYDDDGRMDFYIGNDGMPADLLHSSGRMRFENAGFAQGVALGVYGQAQAAMGADWADYDRDGRLDLVAAKFSHEPLSLYRNNGTYFDNVSAQMGLIQPTLLRLTFGTKFVDVDSDGWPDVVLANGSVYDTANKIDPQTTYLQQMQLFMNRAGKRFEEVSTSAGPPFQQFILGRGLADGDFDEDGRQDLLVVDEEGKPLLLRNETAAPNHWLEVELRGAAPNRFAYGARVTMRQSGQVWVLDEAPSTSYLSSSSPWLHFGLGGQARIDYVDVRWPNTRKERFPCGAVDRRIVLTQGKGRVIADPRPQGKKDYQ